MSKRILLVNPPIYDFSAFDLWMKPLGLLYVGALLRQAGYEAALVNAMDRRHPAVRGRLPHKEEYGCGAFHAEEVPKPRVFAHIPRRFRRFGLPSGVMLEEMRRHPRPDLIAVTSTMTYWCLGVFEAVELARKAFPGVPALLGGIYATLCADHARAHSGADHVLCGPAELSLMKHLGAAPAAWERLRPACDLLPELESVTVLTSRGCPFRCSYCASRLLSSGFKQREPGDVADEIAGYVQTRGTTDVAFYDDALLLNADGRLLETLRLLNARGVRARFHTPNGLHTRLVTPEVARALKAANFCTLRLSFETASRVRQLDSDGKVANEDLQTAVRNLLDAGFSRRQFEVYIMFGFPGQTLDEVQETLAFVHRCGARINLAQFSPIPGTPEFERAAEVHPAIRTEPLLHNKTAFHQLGGRFDFDTYNTLKRAIAALNAALTS